MLCRGCFYVQKAAFMELYHVGLRVGVDDWTLYRVVVYMLLRRNRVFILGKQRSAEKIKA